MWECAKEKFTKQELYYKMLLAKDQWEGLPETRQQLSAT